MTTVCVPYAGKAAGKKAIPSKGFQRRTIVAKLNQIVAIEKGIKANTLRGLTDVYHQLQKTPMMSGISRTYKPKDDEGDKLPAEFTKVQVDALDVVGKIGTISLTGPTRN
jgi:hypothetical protein